MYFQMHFDQKEDVSFLEHNDAGALIWFIDYAEVGVCQRYCWPTDVDAIHNEEF